MTKAPNLSASVSRNTALGIVSNVVQMGTRLVTVPFAIHALGLGGYGIWNIITTVAGYMRFGSVGIKSAFQKYVAEATGDGDYAKANRLLSTGCAAMLVLSIIGLIPVALYSHRIAHAAGVPTEFLESAAASISLLAVILLMSNVGAAFEAIITGGHRLDIIRKLSIVLATLEAVAIIIVLHMGYGLFAMSAIMGVSELAYVCFCFVVARSVLPQIQVAPRFISQDVLYELFRFAGSYQLVNVLEIVYGSILPFAILRAFGAEWVGLVGIVNRVVNAAVAFQDSFLAPILSAATMVYAAGASERMERVIIKAFKATLTLSLLPLSFVATFGPAIVLAWTGRSDASFQTIFWLISINVFFRSFSLLSLVLYRVSGKAVMDNIRQCLRIVIILTAALLAPVLGIYGLLSGLAIAEFAGMLFMLFALTNTFQRFHLSSLVRDAIKMTATAIMMMVSGLLASLIPAPENLGQRYAATFKLVSISVACGAAILPGLLVTRSLTREELKTIVHSLIPRRLIVAQEIGH